VDYPAFDASRGKRVYCSSKCPCKVWGPRSFLFSWYRGAVPPVMKTTHTHLVPGSRKCGAMPLLFIYALVLCVQERPICTDLVIQCGTWKVNSFQNILF
jgi:hypothetical protein